MVGVVGVVEDDVGVVEDDVGVVLTDQRQDEEEAGLTIRYEDELLLDDLMRYKPVNCCERNCCGGLQGMACGWPKGTVRAIIAITLLIVVLIVEGFLAVWLVVHGNETAAVGVGAGMLAEVGAAFGFYFGSRSSKTDDDTRHHLDGQEDRVPRYRRR